MKQPKELRMKRRKNLSTDVMGNTLARIHVGRQEVDKVQTRKMKGLKKDKKKPADSTVEPTEEDWNEGLRWNEAPCNILGEFLREWGSL